jgi:membrane protein
MKPKKRLGGLTWKQLAGRSWKQFWANRMKDQSAALSFFLLLSFFPLALILIHFLGLLYQSGPELRESMSKYLARLAPSEASGLVDRTIAEVTRGSGAATISIQFLLTWMAASQGVMAVIDGLNQAYGVNDSRPWWRRFLGGCVLTILSLLILAAGLLILVFGGHVSAFIGNISGYGNLVSEMWQIMDWLIFVGLVFFLFNVLYIFGPAVKHRRWRWFMPGTVVGVGIWLIVSFGFKVYLHFLDYYSHTYGSIGAVVILMLWFFFFGISIFAGAVVNSEIEKAAGTVDRV